MSWWLVGALSIVVGVLAGVLRKALGERDRVVDELFAFGERRESKVLGVLARVMGALDRAETDGYLSTTIGHASGCPSLSGAATGTPCTCGFDDLAREAGVAWDMLRTRRLVDPGSRWRSVRAAIVATLLVFCGLASVSRAEPIQMGSSLNVYVGAESVFSDSPRSEVPFGRVVAQAGVGAWALSARVDATGLPGKFALEQPGTYQAIEGYVSVSRGLIRQTGNTLSVTAWAGSSFGYDLAGKALVKPHPFAYAAGGRYDHAGGGWGVLGVGEHDLIPGWSVQAAGCVPLFSRTSGVADAIRCVSGCAVGQSYLLRFGLAVRP